MLRKRICVALFIIISVFVAESFIINGLAEPGVWTKPTLTAELGEGSDIDGLKGDDWDEANRSVYEFAGDPVGREFTLFSQYAAGFLYILIELEFPDSNENQTVSLYITNSTDTLNKTFDKKQITFNNITGDDSSEVFIYDEYKNLTTEEFVLDTEDVGFNGAAAVASNQTNPNRIFEYALPIGAPANPDEDVTLQTFGTYIVQIGYNSSSGLSEIISEEMQLQIGYSVSGTNGVIGEFFFNTELYIIIVMISVSVVFGMYGIALVSERSKVPKAQEEE